MSLLDTLNQDLKTAMISKDVVARDTIRMIISDIKKYEIDERLEADDAVISTLINKTVKQRRDSIEQFKMATEMILLKKNKSNSMLSFAICLNS